MTTKTRLIKNETKVTQMFYDRHNNPITLKPGQTFTEDLSGTIDIAALVNRERERQVLGTQVDEARRVKRAFAMIRATKKLEELDKFKEGETNQDVLDAILLKEKELLDGDNRGPEDKA